MKHTTKSLKGKTIKLTNLIGHDKELTLTIRKVINANGKVNCYCTNQYGTGCVVRLNPADVETKIG